MKQKRIYGLLGLEALLLAGLLLAKAAWPQTLSSLFAFPFAPIALGLRALSGLGKWGNGLAVLLWAALALLPLLFLLRGKEQSGGERAISILLSLLLFAVYYSYCNPAVLAPFLPGGKADFLPLMQGALGCTVWAFSLCWLVLRCLYLFRRGNTERLLDYLRLFLYALCAVFVAIIVLGSGSALVEDWKAAQSVADSVFALLRFAVAALPVLLSIPVTIAALRLLHALKSEAGLPEAAADGLSRLCCRTLCWSSVAAALWNLLQLLFAPRLSQVHIEANIPILSLSFVLLVLLLSRLLVEKRRLQQDNDLFI